jgi:hypothetical protein
VPGLALPLPRAAIFGVGSPLRFAVHELAADLTVLDPIDPHLLLKVDPKCQLGRRELNVVLLRSARVLVEHFLKVSKEFDVLLGAYGRVLHDRLPLTKTAHREYPMKRLSVGDAFIVIH